MNQARSYREKRIAWDSAVLVTRSNQGSEVPKAKKVIVPQINHKEEYNAILIEYDSRFFHNGSSIICWTFYDEQVWSKEGSWGTWLMQFKSILAMNGPVDRKLQVHFSFGCLTLHALEGLRRDCLPKNPNEVAFNELLEKLQKLYGTWTASQDMFYQLSYQHPDVLSHHQNFF